MQLPTDPEWWREKARTEPEFTDGALAGGMAPAADVADSLLRSIFGDMTASEHPPLGYPCDREDPDFCTPGESYVWRNELYDLMHPLGHVRGLWCYEVYANGFMEVECQCCDGTARIRFGATKDDRTYEGTALDGRCARKDPDENT